MTKEGLDFLNSQVFPKTRAAGIPDQAVVGQWAAEGRYVNPKNNNPFNLIYNGVVHSYQNIDNGIKDYVLTVQNLLKNKGYDINKLKNDPKGLLTALQDPKGPRFEGHKKDPYEYVKLATSTPEWEQFNSPQNKSSQSTQSTQTQNQLQIQKPMMTQVGNVIQKAKPAQPAQTNTGQTLASALPKAPKVFDVIPPDTQKTDPNSIPSMPWDSPIVNAQTGKVTGTAGSPPSPSLLKLLLHSLIKPAY